MSTKNKKKEFEEIIEGLTQEELADILALSRLKIATQEENGLFVTGDDWSNTPKQVRLAVGYILGLVKATIPELLR